ncbi:hypothetical protein [Bordetella sp. LUAb4]|uniref:hypothetical protein n=1 Tax=Bordetella sp. LUAb4 TaxID=2843195 RepID=UPI001E393F4F|nr:hypothetical protein [Bordetella sp. LUAb4]
MILTSIAEVRNYMLELSRNLPGSGERFSLVANRTELLSEVVQELKLPSKYLSIAQKNRILGISIGFFDLSPSLSSNSLEDSLLDGNGSDSLVKMFGDNSLVAVACCESNPICVASSVSDHPDVVYFLDTMSGPQWNVCEIADDFEKFILLAANLHQISFDFEGDLVGGRDEMAKCCVLNSCSPKQAAFWDQQAVMMLA